MFALSTMLEMKNFPFPDHMDLMSLKMLQGFHMEESRRGKAGLGNYTLKPKYTQFQTNVDDFQSMQLVCHPRDIVKSI